VFSHNGLRGFTIAKAVALPKDWVAKREQVVQARRARARPA
jgi:hypothetical protein